MNLFLTSNGFSTQHLKETFYNEFLNGKEKSLKIALIVNATPKELRIIEKFNFVKSQLESLGLTNFIYADLYLHKSEILSSNILYFCGGNPELLFSDLKNTQMDTLIENLIDKYIIVGESAGSMVLGSSFGFIDENLFENKALNFYKTPIFPHFDREKYNKYDELAEKYETKFNVNIKRLVDGQAIICKNGSSKTLYKICDN